MASIIVFPHLAIINPLLEVLGNIPLVGNYCFYLQPYEWYIFITHDTVTRKHLNTMDIQLRYKQNVFNISWTIKIYRTSHFKQFLLSKFLSNFYFY